MDIPYSDGYEDKPEFRVSVPLKKCSLDSDGLVSLGIECYAHAHAMDEEKDSVVLFFRKKVDAQSFVDIINLHAKLKAKKV